MARITVELPSVLAGLLGGRRDVALEAATLRQALEEVVRAHPVLGRHLFDETGGLRQHVLCFWNGTNTRWVDERERPLSDGDVLTFIQAVSGG